LTELRCAQSRALRVLQKIRLLALAALACASLAHTYALASDEKPDASQLAIFNTSPEQIYGEQAIYDVYRNNDLIGSHVVNFEHGQNELVINVESKLAVKMLGITVYRFSYKASEVWSAGELVLMETTVNDNRKKVRTIKAANQGKFLLVEDSRKQSEFSAPLPEFSSNHWHPGALFAKRIFHTLHGKLYKGPPTSLGWERIVFDKQTIVSARRYSYTGGFNADVWYDKDWRWVKLAFRADDGSAIEYKCRSCGL